MPLRTRATSIVCPAACGAARSASAALRSQAVHLPARGIGRAPEADAVMQPIFAAVPEFDFVRCDTIPSPMLWTRHVAGRILLTQSCVALLDFGSRRQGLALRGNRGG